MSFTSGHKSKNPVAIPHFVLVLQSTNPVCGCDGQTDGNSCEAACSKISDLFLDFDDTGFRLSGCQFVLVDYNARQKSIYWYICTLQSSMFCLCFLVQIDESH